MTSDAAPAPPTADKLGPTRRRVLRFLQQSPTPVAVEPMATALDLHPNTVRFHASALRAAGLVQRITEPRATQGRPRDLYAAVPEAPSVAGDHYRDLAMALTSYVTTALPEPEAAALAAGRAWGERIATSEPPARDLRDLVDTVNAMGFSSRILDDPPTPTLEITRCPYRDLALAEQRVVCTMHLGLMRGYLDASGAELQVTELEPWARPNVCLARFAERRGDDG